MLSRRKLFGFLAAAPVAGVAAAKALAKEPSDLLQVEHLSALDQDICTFTIRPDRFIIEPSDIERAQKRLAEGKPYSDD
jgi:hypothetical protein